MYKQFIIWHYFLFIIIYNLFVIHYFNNEFIVNKDTSIMTNQCLIYLHK